MDNIELFFNLITMLLFPLLLKILNDTQKLYEKVGRLEEDVKNIKEDVKKLEGCLYDVKKRIFTK